MNNRLVSAEMEDASPADRTPLTADERQRLRLVHHRLRNASQAVESLLATEQLRGRWAPAPAPPEAVRGALNELRDAYQAMVACHQELSL
jgi:two-component sensor histidine kinase